MWFQFDARSNVLRLTKLYDWYDDNFVQVADSTTEFAARYSPELKRALEGGSLPHRRFAGLDAVDYLTNKTLFSLNELPLRLGVIGAGSIGCEMAQAFAQLGSEVFLVEAEHGILPREDRNAAEIVQKVIVRDGVKLLCCDKKLDIQHDEGSRLVVESHGRGYDKPIDKLLVSVSRAPYVENLDLEAVGVDYGKKGVKVNGRIQTTSPGFTLPEIFVRRTSLRMRPISWRGS